VSWLRYHIVDGVFQLDAHEKRLRVFQLQEAKRGIGAAPAITNEIEEIEEKVADIKRQLQRLQP
jgi:hypothetical protein